MITMPSLMFPNLERANHSVELRWNKVWALNMAVVCGLVRTAGGLLRTTAKETKGGEREGTKTV